MAVNLGSGGPVNPSSVSEEVSSNNLLYSVMSAAGGVATRAIGSVASYISGAVSEAEGGTNPPPSGPKPRADSDWDLIELDSLKDMADADGHRAHQGEMQKLKQRLEEYEKRMIENSNTIEALKEENKKLNSKLVKAEQWARDLELKQSSGAGAGVRNLQGQNKQQAQLVLSLKDRIRQLEETLELTETDKTSFGDLLQEAEDDRDKFKDDLVNAREEIKSHKMTIASLKRELATAKQESAKKMPSERTSPLGYCSKQECVERRTRYNTLESAYEDQKMRVDELEKIVEAKIKEIFELEMAKNEAISDIAAAKMEAEVYKADFFEERKDRERAWAKLDELQEQKGGQDTVFHEERARLFKDINKSNLENATLKSRLAKLEKQEKTSKGAMELMKEQIEKLTRERDDWKHEVERRKASKNQKLKEYDKLKVQLSDAHRTAVRLTDQLEEVRKEKEEVRKQKKELQKSVGRLEERLRKAEKKEAKAHGSSQADVSTVSRQVQGERLYEEERNRNESLQHRITELQGDISHYQEIILSLKQMIKKEVPLVSPSDGDKSLASHTTEQINMETQSNPFQGDPNYVPSDPDPPFEPNAEAAIRRQLQKPFAQAKQLSPGSTVSAPQVLLEAGTGNIVSQQQNQMERRTDSHLSKKTPTHPMNMEMSRGEMEEEMGRSAGKRRGQLQGNKEDIRRDVLTRAKAASQQQQTPASAAASSANFPNRSSERPARLQGQPKSQPSLHAHSNTSQGAVALPGEGRRGSYPSHEQPFRAGASGSNQHLQVSDEAHAAFNRQSSQPQPQLTREPLRAGGTGPSAFTYQSQTNDLVSASDRPLSDISHDRRRQLSQSNKAKSFDDELSPSYGVSSETHPGPRAPQGQHQLEDSSPYVNYPAETRARVAVKSAPVDQQASSPTGVDADTQTSIHPSRGFATQTSVTAKGAISTQTSREEPRLSATEPVTRPPPTQGGAKSQSKQSRRREVPPDDTENVLVHSIDREIQDMAADVKEEVSLRNERLMTMEHKPYDENLVCPMCGKKHRIGEIQKFRLHVEDCEGGALV